MSDERTTSPRLVIEELRVLSREGRMALSVQFKDGINVIRGESSTGRTTLLQLIEFGLGKRLASQHFIPEIAQCEKMVMQFLLNGTRYTIDRKFGVGSRQISYYPSTIDDPLRPPVTIISVEGDYSNFLLFQLGIPRVSFLDERAEKERVISFSDIANALYIDQDYGFSEIHARLRGEYKRTNVFKLLLGISVLSLYEVESQEALLKRLQTDKVKEYDAIARFLGALELPTEMEFTGRVSDLTQHKEQITGRAVALRSTLRSQSTNDSPLREQVLTLESEVAEKRQSVIFARQTLQSYLLMANQLQDDLDKVGRIRFAATQLSSFDFEMCPRCLQDITADMKERELDNNCSVCGRQLLTSSDETNEVSKYEQQVNAQLKELDELQEQYRLGITEDEQTLEVLQAQLITRRQDLDVAVSNYVAPVIQEVEDLGYQLARIDEELQHVEELRRWRARLQEMQDELNEIDSQIAVVRDQKEALQERERANVGAIRQFESFFRQFISDLYPEFQTAIITNDNFWPVINGHNYKSKSAIQRNIAILGYHYALLRFSLEENSNVPRILMIDTIRQDDLDNSLYERILKKFKDLENMYRDSFQLLLVLRDRVEFLVEDEVLALVGGNHLLKIAA